VIKTNNRIKTTLATYDVKDTELYKGVIEVVENFIEEREK
jgi:hypothetical protein